MRTILLLFSSLILNYGNFALAQACISNTGRDASAAYRSCEDKYCDPRNAKECVTEDRQGYLKCVSQAVDAFSRAVDDCHAEVQKDIAASVEARKQKYNQLCSHDSDCAAGLHCRFAGWEGLTSACLP